MTKMSLFRLYKELLGEVFDLKNIKIFSTNYINRGYKFKTDLGDVIEVKFEDILSDLDDFDCQDFIKKDIKSAVNISFSVNNKIDQAKKLELKDMYPIAATVKLCIDQYIHKFKPDLVSIISTHRLLGIGTDSTKNKIFEMIYRKYPPNGYGVTDCKYIPANMTGFCLYRNLKIKTNALRR